MLASRPASDAAAATTAVAAFRIDYKKTNERVMWERNADQQHARRRHLVKCVSCCLQQLYGPEKAKTVADRSQLTMFHAESIPSLNISSYCQRIAKYSECSGEVLTLALIYINRVTTYHPCFDINAYNIHRLLLTSVLCAAKFFDDRYYNNAFYAKIGGIPTRELNYLEVEFLAMVNFELFVKPTVYEVVFKQISDPSVHLKCSCRTWTDGSGLLAYDLSRPNGLAVPEPVHHHQRQQEETIAERGARRAVSPASDVSMMEKDTDDGDDGDSEDERERTGCAPVCMTDSRESLSTHTSRRTSRRRSKRQQKAGEAGAKEKLVIAAKTKATASAFLKESERRRASSASPVLDAYRIDVQQSSAGAVSQAVAVSRLGSEMNMRVPSDDFDGGAEPMVILPSDEHADADTAAQSMGGSQTVFRELVSIGA